MFDDNPPEISVAIREGNVHKMLQMLEDQPAQVHSTNENGYTPLHYAARYNHFECAPPLLHYGANVNAKTVYGDTPLHEAAAYASIEFVRWLLIHGAEVNARGYFGEPPLKLALGGKAGYLRENLIPVVSLLISSGADVNAPDDSGHQPIHSAAKISLEAVQLLVAHGANINAEAEDGYGRSPLLCTMSDTGNSKELVQERERICDYLLDHGADVNISDYGDTILHHAARRKMVKLLSRLLELGADVNAQQDRSGLTPLHLAAGGLDGIEPVRVLLLNGADPNLGDSNGRTSLHTAANDGTAERVHFLLDHGADLEARDEMGWTPLHMAASSLDPATAEALIQRGAEINPRDNEGRTPLFLAQNGPWEIDAYQDYTKATAETIDLLLKHGATI